MHRILLILLLTLSVLAQAPREPARVVRVVDGDTLRVRLASGEEVKVRLIGIDCPETRNGQRLEAQARDLGVPPDELEKVGEQATSRVEKLVAGGEVWLEYDQGRLDRYGRTLAYVWLDEDTMLNEQVLKEGLAVAFPVSPNLRNQEQLARTAQEAKAARLGLWALTGKPEARRKQATPQAPEPEPEPEFPVGIVLAVLGLLGLGLLGGLVVLRSRPQPSEPEEVQL